MRTSKGTGFGPGWHETHINSKPNVGSRVSTCVALQEVSNIEPNGGDSTGTTVDGSGFHMQCGGKERLLNTVSNLSVLNGSHFCRVFRLIRFPVRLCR